jgi:hypothetical protein
MEPLMGVEPTDSCLPCKPTSTRGPAAWHPWRESNPLTGLRRARSASLSKGMAPSARVERAHSGSHPKDQIPLATV